MQLLCDRFFLGQRRAIITQKGNTQQKKIMSAPRSKLVNQWAFTGLSNKSMDQGLLPQTRNDSEAAASLNSSPNMMKTHRSCKSGALYPAFSQLGSPNLSPLYSFSDPTPLKSFICLLISMLPRKDAQESFMFLPRHVTFCWPLGSWTFSSLLHRMFQPRETWNTALP